MVRGEFLCDALGWIDYLEEMEDPVFDIRLDAPEQIQGLMTWGENPKRIGKRMAKDMTSKWWQINRVSANNLLIYALKKTANCAYAKSAWKP